MNFDLGAFFTKWLADWRVDQAANGDLPHTSPHPGPAGGGPAWGGIVVALDGGSFFEQSLFADSMGELLGPVQNPRYIMTREGEGALKDRLDFHSVPTCLGVKKELAEGLLFAWHRYVGPADLIFTRRKGGHAALLAARTRAFSGALEAGLRRLDRWQ